MKILHKILGFLIVVFFAFLFSYFSFFYQTDSSSEDISGLMNDFSHELSEGVSFVKIDSFGSVYYSGEAPQIDTQGEAIKIEAGRGIYFFHLYGKKEVQLQGNLFSLSQKNPGSFFLDTRDIKKYTLFSLSSLVRFDFLNAEQEFLTDVYLYPHNVLQFNLLRARTLENADFLRVSQKTTLGYIQHNIGDEAFFDFFDTDQTKFLKETLSDLQAWHKHNNVLVEKIQNTPTLEVPFFAYMQKYFQLFINENKKVVYYKNEILHTFYKLSRGEKNTSVKKYFTTIDEALNSLKKLDEAEYLSMKDFSEYMFGALFQNIYFSEKDFLHPWYENSEKDFFPLQQSYEGYDFHNKPLDSNLLGFLEKYTSQYQKNENKREKDYFLFYIEKIILSASKKNIFESPSVIRILPLYFTLYSSVQSSQEEKSARVQTHMNILSNLEANVLNHFFMRNSETQLLEKNILSDSLGDFRNFQILYTGVQNMFSFFEVYRNYLDGENEKNLLLLDDYNNFQDSFLEYFVALDDYDSYIIRYNKGLRDINSKTIQSLQDNTRLSIPKIEAYLNTFSGFNLKQVEINLEEDFYKISNVFIDGQGPFTFEIYPQEGNLLRAYGDGISGSSYRLDLLEEEYEERFASAAEEKKYQFDFSNFFLLNFGKKISSTDLIKFQETDTGQQEEKWMIQYKNSKLVGRYGEFSNIKDTINIQYDDITVAQKGNTVEVVIDSFFPLDIKDRVGMRGNLMGKYRLTDRDHYFYDSYIIFSQVKSGSSVSIFSSVPLQLIGEIPITEIENVITQIENTFVALESIAQQLIFLESITYNREEKLFILKNAEYTIHLQKGFIINVKRGDEILYNEKIPYTALRNILNKK